MAAGGPPSRPEGLARGLVEEAAARALRYALAEEYGVAWGDGGGEGVEVENAVRTWEVLVEEGEERKICKIFVETDDAQSKVEKVLPGTHSVIGMDGGGVLVEMVGGDAVWGLVGEEERIAIVTEMKEDADVSDGSKLYGLMRRVEGRLREVVRKSAKWALDESGGDAKRLWELMQGSPPDARESVLWAKWVAGEMKKSKVIPVAKALKDSIAPGESDAEVMAALDDGRAALLCWAVPNQGYVSRNILPGWDSVDLSLLCTSLERLPGLYCRSDAVAKSVELAGDAGARPPIEGEVQALRELRHRIAHGTKLDDANVALHLATARKAIEVIVRAFRESGCADERTLSHSLTSLASLLPHFTLEEFRKVDDGDWKGLMKGLWVEAERQALHREETKKEWGKAEKRHHEIMEALERGGESKVKTVEEVVGRGVGELRVRLRGLEVLGREEVGVKRESWQLEDADLVPIPIDSLRQSKQLVFLVDEEASRNVGVEVKVGREWVGKRSFSLYESRDEAVRMIPQLRTLEAPVLAGEVVVVGEGGEELLRSEVREELEVDWAKCTPLWFASALRTHYRALTLRLLTPRLVGGAAVEDVAIREIFQLNNLARDNEAARARLREQAREGTEVGGGGEGGGGEGEVADRQSVRETLVIAREGEDGVEDLDVTEADVFAKRDARGGLRARLEGAPGVGKSTLMKHIAQGWADGEAEWLREFDLVVFLPLNRVKEAVREGGREADEGHLWAEVFGELMREAGKEVRGEANPFTFAQSTHLFSLLLAYHKKQDSNVLYLLDGLDEVGEEEQVEGSAGARILSTLSSHSSLILTSRPLSSLTLIPTSSSYLLTGLPKESQEAFVCWYLGVDGVGDGAREEEKEEEHEDGGEGAEEFFLEALREHRNLRILARIPVMLEIMCLVSSGEGKKELLDGHITPIYEAASEQLMVRWARKTARGEVAEARFLREHRGVAEEFLEGLALRVWKEREVVMRGDDVVGELRKAVGGEVDEEVMGVYLKGLGIVQPLDSGVPTRRWEEVDWSFPHLTLAEFYAARAWEKRVREVVGDKGEDVVRRSVGLHEGVVGWVSRRFSVDEDIRRVMKEELGLSRSKVASQELIETRASSYLWPFLVYRLSRDENGGSRAFGQFVCQRLSLYVTKGNIKTSGRSVTHVWIGILNELPREVLEDSFELFVPSFIDLKACMFSACLMGLHSLVSACSKLVEGGWNAELHGRTMMEHLQCVPSPVRRDIEWLLAQPGTEKRLVSVRQMQAYQDAVLNKAWEDAKWWSSFTVACKGEEMCAERFQYFLKLKWNQNHTPKLLSTAVKEMFDSAEDCSCLSSLLRRWFDSVLDADVEAFCRVLKHLESERPEASTFNEVEKERLAALLGRGSVIAKCLASKFLLASAECDERSRNILTSMGVLDAASGAYIALDGDWKVWPALLLMFLAHGSSQRCQKIAHLVPVQSLLQIAADCLSNAVESGIIARAVAGIASLAHHSERAQSVLSEKESIDKCLKLLKSDNKDVLQATMGLVGTLNFGRSCDISSLLHAVLCDAVINHFRDTPEFGAIPWVVRRLVKRTGLVRLCFQEECTGGIKFIARQWKASIRDHPNVSACCAALLRLICSHSQYKTQALEWAGEEDDAMFVRDLADFVERVRYRGIDWDPRVASRVGETFAGVTVLHGSVWNGEEENVRRLLLAGADVDAVNYARKTPIHDACHQGEAELLKLLLQCGGDRESISKQRACTPLMLAAQHGHVKIVEVLLAPTGIKALEIECAFDTTNTWGETALDLAIAHGNDEVERLLREKCRL